MEHTKKVTEVHDLTILDEEDVVRLLHPDWVVKGKLQIAAFTLRSGETYISVNRPVIETYSDDVRGFLMTHPDFHVDDCLFRRAIMGVKDIRSIKVKLDNKEIAIDVEVEPRDRLTKSHAGIFSRYEGKNIKVGQEIVLREQQKGVSSDDVLMDIGWSLLSISSVEESRFKPNKE